MIETTHFIKSDDIPIKCHVINIEKLKKINKLNKVISCHDHCRHPCQRRHESSSGHFIALNDKNCSVYNGLDNIRHLLLFLLSLLMLTRLPARTNNRNVLMFTSSP